MIATGFVVRKHSEGTQTLEVEREVCSSLQEDHLSLVAKGRGNRGPGTLRNRCVMPLISAVPCKETIPALKWNHGKIIPE